MPVADVIRRAGALVGPIFDNFNRTVADLDGDKTSDDNGTWESLRATGGVWDADGVYARYTGPDTDDPVAVVDAGTPDVDITLDVDEARDSIIFRANDADNYWMMTGFYDTYTFASGNSTKYCTGSSWNCCNGSNTANCVSTHTHGCGSCSSNTTSCCCNTGYYSHSHTCSHGHSTSCGNSNTNNYACGTNTNYSTGYYRRVYFRKKVAGVVSDAASYVNSNVVSQLRVVAVGNSISFHVNGSATPNRTVDDPFNASANKHGIGRHAISGSHDRGTQIDNFNLTPVEP